MRSVFLSLLVCVNVYAGVVGDAYQYGYPLVLMDVTKDVFTDTPVLTEEKAPLNQFLIKKTFPDPSFKEVVSPNADTLYSSAWLDLRAGPVVLSVPEMGDRYYLYPMLDEWTNVFFSPGTRTTGNGKGEFAVVGPDWKGTLPPGVKEVRAPTNFVWILGRIQTNGSEDYAAVNKLQEQFKLTPLNKTSLTMKSGIDGKTPPVDQVSKMDGQIFFSRLAELLKTTPIPERDLEYVKKFAQIGLVPGKSFSPTLPNETLNNEVQAAKNKMQEDWDNHSFATTENGWGVMIKDVGNYGTNYELRAAVAFGGLGANLPQDAVYPTTTTDSKGERLNGKNRYVIHFDKGVLPPVNAFWSVTMYNAENFFVANPINRYAIGSKDKLVYNQDGSLDLYLQNQPPTETANWLPAPEGDFNLLMRLYSPKPEVLDGSWKPPFVEKK